MYARRRSEIVSKISEIQSFKTKIEEEIIDRYARQDEHAAHVKKKQVPAEGWRGCFLHYDGTIYLAGRNKSIDYGKTLVQHNVLGLDKISILQFIGIPTPTQIGDEPQPGPEGAVLSRPGLFLALDGRVYFDSPGIYTIRIWRSTNDLETVEEEKAILKVPDGPRRDRHPSEWFGLYICRDIIEMSDGTLLATAEGNFEADRILPSAGSGKSETHYLGRTFVISSKDEGQSWEYLSVPKAISITKFMFVSLSAHNIIAF